MKINKKPTKKTAIILVAILLIITFCAVAYFVFKPNDETVKRQENEKKQQETSDQAKKDFIENTNEDGSAPKDTPTEPTEPTTPDTTNNVEVSARNESNGTVTVLTKLTSIPRGTCTLQVKNAANTTSKTAPVIYQEQYSSCAGFSLTSADKTTLGTGTWEFTLSVLSSEKTYTASTSLEVK